MTAVAIETELKLRIAPAAARTLARHAALRPLKRGRARTRRVVTTYFDTGDDMLATAGVALRLRHDGRGWLQSIKGSATAAGGGLTARPEFEWPVAGAHLDPLRFAATPFRRVLARAERAGLVRRFATDITRTTIPLAFPDGTLAQLCIDVGRIRGADSDSPRSVAVHEIEFELEAGDPGALFALARDLAADVPLGIEPASKASRGYALLRAADPTPVTAEVVALPRQASAGAALAAIVRSCTGQIEGNAQGVVDGDGTDPEWIHQMRVGVRRLRACLSLARRGVTAAGIDPLRVELRWLAMALGPARDLDVFVLTTLPDLQAAAQASQVGRLAPALATLTLRAGKARRAAHAAAKAAVRSRRFVSAALAAGALAAALARDVDGLAGGKLARPARDFARPLLRRRHAALCALGRDLVHAAPQERHAARLAAKKLRYATEFFAPLFREKRARRYRQALAALQDELGAWNDVAVATELAARLAGAHSAAAAAFAGWAAARRIARSEALARAWADFAAARPFWTHRH